MGGTTSIALALEDASAEMIASYVKNFGASYEDYSKRVLTENISGLALSTLTNFEEALIEFGVDNKQHRHVLQMHLHYHTNLIPKQLLEQKKIEEELQLEATLSNNTARPSLKFDNRGVTLTCMETFITTCGGSEMLIGLTTKEVCEQFVKLFTYSTQSSYCEHLQNELTKNDIKTALSTSTTSTTPSNYTKTANVFISHAWQFMFLDVVSAIKYHFRQEDPNSIVLWFDLFSNNQHKAPAYDFHWWSTVFKSAIAEIGHVVLILSPWHNPIPLTRVWCLFEIYCSVESMGKFEVAMSETEQERFLKTITTDFDAVNRLIATVDVENSESTSQSDKEKIFHVVRSTIGFNNINSMVFGQLRDWIVKTVQEAVHNETNEDNALALKEGLAEIYRAHGRYNEADALYEECLEKRKNNLVENFTKILSTRQILAAMYVHQGKYEKAEPHFAASWQAYNERFGSDHADTIRSMASLANIYMQQGYYAKAETIFEDAMKAATRTFGFNHPNTLWCINNTAIAYRSQAKLLAAEKLYLSSIEVSKTALGEDHPNTLTMINNLASLYCDMGLFQNAKQLYRQCIDKQTTKLGFEHPNTLTAIHNLSVLYYDDGDYKNAEELAMQAYTNQLKTLGDHHEDTLSSLDTLASIYDDQGRYDDAQKFYMNCLTLRKSKQGVAHPKTLEVMNNLAILYYHIGEYDKAIELLTECLQIGLPRMGEENPQVMNWKNSLSEITHLRDNPPLEE